MRIGEEGEIEVWECIALPEYWTEGGNSAALTPPCRKDIRHERVLAWAKGDRAVKMRIEVAELVMKLNETGHPDCPIDSALKVERSIWN